MAVITVILGLSLSKAQMHLPSRPRTCAKDHSEPKYLGTRPEGSISRMKDRPDLVLLAPPPPPPPAPADAPDAAAAVVGM
jgi:hypothetical protein